MTTTKTGVAHAGATADPAANGALVGRVEARELDPGIHGMHEHEAGRRDTPAFTTAAGHDAGDGDPHRAHGRRRRRPPARRNRHGLAGVEAGMTTMLRTSVIALVALALPGCYVEGAACVPTRTAARPADKVDVRAAARSGTVEARLTAEGEPLSGRELRFEVLDDGATVHEDSAVTGANGVARLDLKRADAASLVALARADRFRATFAGDSEHCRSSDDAVFRTVRT